MGFNTSATTSTLIARLTPYGRQRLLVNDINIITKFSLGDSDANYYTNTALPTGEIPNIGGTLGGNSTNTNSSCQYSNIRRPINYLPNGIIFKKIEPTSFMVTTDIVKLGVQNITSSALTQTVVNRNTITGANAADGNLFSSFGLPITTIEQSYFTTMIESSGGYRNTALSGLNQDNILVIGINQNKYGEMLDGKTIKVSVTSSGGTYDIYGTYQKGVANTNVLDGSIREQVNSNLKNIGNPVTLLFSDSINKPNGDTSLSWATGFGSIKPFTVGGKEMFNNKTSNAAGQTADTVVGIAYLDKGFIVITNPDIVNGFNMSATTATTISFNSVVSEVAQNITCIKDRNEFGVSMNPTFSSGDIVRISELGLYDDEDKLIAIAKPDRHLEIPSISFMALSVKITV